jgi:hypothetical protein
LFSPKAPVDLGEAASGLLKTAAANGGPTLTANMAVDSLPVPLARPIAPSAAIAPISVLVSRKEGKLFVRQGYAPVLESAVSIRDPEHVLGTHVFTAMELQEDGAAMRWTVVSMASEVLPKPTGSTQQLKQLTRKRAGAKPQDSAVKLPSTAAATAALERIDIPNEVVERISELLTPGSSFIVSDAGVSAETGADTDFIVLTR